MGYDLHITRARSWVDSESQPITPDEWRAFVASDPRLEIAGVDLRQGRLVVKNPDEPTIAKMIEVALHLGGRVVGDDGEVYERAGEPPRPASLPWRERVGAWIERLRPRPKLQPARVSFAVGDRVRDALGREAVVVAIDLTAEHGIGHVCVRFDDGREITLAAIAHGLTVVESRYFTS